jgi:hypothetical protein
MGKLMTGQNAIKHGYYSRMPLGDAGEFKAFVKALKRGASGRGRHPDPGVPVWGMEGADVR